MRFHREGTKILQITTAIGVVLLVLNWIVIARSGFTTTAIILTSLVLLVLFLIYNFFRNPKRTIEHRHDHILAPCDGKVVAIEKVHEQVYFKRPMIQISIFMSPLNVHVTRNPISGKVMVSKYVPGKFLAAFLPKSSTENEHTFIVVRNNYTEVGFKQIAGGVARRLVNYLSEGDQVYQGSEFGFIKFGSRMDIFIDPTALIKVKLGQKSVGGHTVLATISI
jgi:phosphatidylserine decarboxylase